MLGVVLGGHLVAPLAERPLGELLDVALVDQRHAAAPVLDGVLDRRPHQALGTGAADRLDADAGVGAHRPAQLPLQELQQLAGLGAAGRHLESGVDILRILPEHHHVHPLRRPHRRRNTGVVLHRAQAHVQVEPLPQGHVETADAAAHRRGERTLDAYQVLAKRIFGRLRQPVAGTVERLLASQYLHPLHAAPGAVRPGHGGIEHPHRRGPDIGSGAVPFDEGNEGSVGDLQPRTGHGYVLAHASSIDVSPTPARV